MSPSNIVLILKSLIIIIGGGGGGGRGLRQEAAVTCGLSFLGQDRGSYGFCVCVWGGGGGGGSRETLPTSPSPR